MDTSKLTERQKDILFAIIEQYAEVAAPVGSVTLARLFDVSSATIRAEMAHLEKFGLIAQPHTSAGRIPTDAGYRYYVNTLTETAEAASKTAPSDRFKDAKYLLEAPADRGIHALEVRIHSQTRIDHAIRMATDALVDLTGNLGLATIGDQLYLSGMSRLFSQPEFMDNSRIRSVAKLLDNLEPWLREARPGEPLNIFIGEENPIGKTSGVSLIISKFRSPLSDSSYIGVLGPTRQNYQLVCSLVRRAGLLLEETL
ncbi:MAG: transcriptional regulator [Candidatus Saccharibacteria bacterium]|nr:transcriptional regulator [Candidatus Saccharibacteria bacterium]